MNEIEAKWLRRLPIRWGLGGFVLGVVWSAVSIVAQGFPNALGGLAAGLTRAFVLIVLPLSVLGFVRGWTEKLTLNRCFTKGDGRLKEVVRRSVSRNTGKAIACGLLFGFFTYGLCLFRCFRPWDSQANVMHNLSGVVAFAFLAAPVGALVGILFRRNLLRRLSDRPERPGLARF